MGKIFIVILVSLITQLAFAQEKAFEDVKSKQDIIEYLISKGFEPMPGKIIPNPKDTINHLLKDLGEFYNGARNRVFDYSGLSMDNPNMPNDTTFFRHGVEFIVAQGLQYGEKITAYITKDENFFDGKFQEVEQIFERSEPREVLWWHIWDNPTPNEDDFYCIKRKDK